MSGRVARPREALRTALRRRSISEISCAAADVEAALPAGRYPLDITVHPTEDQLASGWSAAYGAAYRVTYSNQRSAGALWTQQFTRAEGAETFDIVINPEITAVSTARSGTLGGQTVTITGTGFATDDCAANVVRLAGARCDGRLSVHTIRILSSHSRIM